MNYCRPPAKPLTVPARQPRLSERAQHRQNRIHTPDTELERDSETPAPADSGKYGSRARAARRRQFVQRRRAKLQRD